MIFLLRNLVFFFESLFRHKGTKNTKFFLGVLSVFVAIILYASLIHDVLSAFSTKIL